MSLPIVNLSTHTYGGNALGRLPDGRAVFVPYTLPGERVSVRLCEEKRAYVRGELVEVLSPSPVRIHPRCPHFGVCGGCHYQHMTYAAQLDAKAFILRDQLERNAGIESPFMQPIVSSSHPFNYRNHVQFHLTPDGKIGYQKAHSNETFAIETCYLLEEALNPIWPLLDIEVLPDLERVSLRLGVGEDILLILESQGDLLPDFSVEELPISVVHLGPNERQVLAGSDHIVMEILDRQFYISAGSFFQVNSFVAEAMVTFLLDQLSLRVDDTILDIYAGAGLFSAFLAPQVGRLVAIESSISACEDFAINLDEYNNVELYQATAEQVLAVLNLKPRIILVDPPRAGLDRQVLQAIMAMQPAVIVYISCDPSTLARDARRLTNGGYQLSSITPFDMFPQTYHVESVSFWNKK
jgi:23S rRNA (uracil1939-C5)-methyltransferase